MATKLSPVIDDVVSGADWLDLAISAARMGSIDWDLVGDTVHIDEQTAMIFNGRAGTARADAGEYLVRAIHPDDQARARDLVLDAIARCVPYEMEHRTLRPNNAIGWVSSAGAPICGPGGKAVRVIGLVRDITERKTAEAQRETLVAELDHRVKNVLASVQSLALQSARKAPSLDIFLKTFAGRLKSMASAHTLLTTTRWRGASMHHIAAAELSGLAPGQTRWEGPEAFLTPRATNALALALHELASNAVKYGALTSDDGHIDVRWSLQPDGGFRLVWHETGGPLTSPPTHQGFGSTLLDKVTGRELGGEVRTEFLATGVRATLTSSAVALVAQPASPVAAPAPIAKVGGSTGDASQAAAAKIAGLKVLIVEDALLLSLELSEGLTEAGAVIVGEAADVEEALSFLNCKFDVAVLDANLNGQSVAPVATALVARGVPFIFATGYGDNQMAPQGFDAPFIRKPYDVTQVAAALAEVTGRS